VSVKSFTNKIIGTAKLEALTIKNENTNNNYRIDKIEIDSNSKCSEGIFIFKSTLNNFIFNKKFEKN
jgi:hypothetical protein